MVFKQKKQERQLLQTVRTVCMPMKLILGDKRHIHKVKVIKIFKVSVCCNNVAKIRDISFHIAHLTAFDLHFLSLGCFHPTFIDQRVFATRRYNNTTFYPRDAMLARVIGIATCPSVRLSVCLSVRHAPVLCQNEES